MCPFFCYIFSSGMKMYYCVGAGGYRYRETNHCATQQISNVEWRGLGFGRFWPAASAAGYSIFRCARDEIELFLALGGHPDKGAVVGIIASELLANANRHKDGI